MCVSVSINKATCMCASGHQLLSDGRSCVGRSFSNFPLLLDLEMYAEVDSFDLEASVMFPIPFRTKYYLQGSSKGGGLSGRIMGAELIMTSPQ